MRLGELVHLVHVLTAEILDMLGLFKPLRLQRHHLHLDLAEYRLRAFDQLLHLLKLRSLNVIEVFPYLPFVCCGHARSDNAVTIKIILPDRFHLGDIELRAEVIDNILEHGVAGARRRRRWRYNSPPARPLCQRPHTT